MSFLDQVQAAGNGGGAGAPEAPVSIPGSLGQGQRPKNRFLDRVLMYNRDRKQQEAQAQLLAEAQIGAGVGFGAPNPMSGSPVSGSPGGLFSPQGR